MANDPRVAALIQSLPAFNPAAITSQRVNAVADPSASQFSKDWSASQTAQAARAQQMQAIGQLDRGVGDSPGAGILNRAYGYFADSPTQAAQRALAVQAMDVLKGQTLPPAARVAAAAATNKVAAPKADVTKDTTKTVVDPAKTPAGMSAADFLKATQGLSFRQMGELLKAAPAPTKPRTYKDQAAGTALALLDTQAAEALKLPDASERAKRSADLMQQLLALSGANQQFLPTMGVDSGE